MRRATIYGGQGAPRPQLEERGQSTQSHVAQLEEPVLDRIADAVTDMLQAALQSGQERGGNHRTSKLD